MFKHIVFSQRRRLHPEEFLRAVSLSGSSSRVDVLETRSDGIRVVFRHALKTFGRNFHLIFWDFAFICCRLEHKT